MLNPTLGKAFVRYRLLEDAVKAQRHLDKCQLGNTTICAEFVPEQEVSRLSGCLASTFPTHLVVRALASGHFAWTVKVHQNLQRGDIRVFEFCRLTMHPNCP